MRTGRVPAARRSLSRAGRHRLHQGSQRAVECLQADDTQARRQSAEAGGLGLLRARRALHGSYARDDAGAGGVRSAGDHDREADSASRVAPVRRALLLVSVALDARLEATAGTRRVLLVVLGRAGLPDRLDRVVRSQRCGDRQAADGRVRVTGEDNRGAHVPASVTEELPYDLSEFHGLFIPNPTADRTHATESTRRGG